MEKFNLLHLYLLGLFIFTSSLVYSQAIEYPRVRYSTQNNVIIKRIQLLKTQTHINFVYKSNENEGRYIYLSPPQSRDAMYIKINDSKYKLLYTLGIANKDGVTACGPGEEIAFSAIFEAIPKNTSEFDLIENNGNIRSWNFYGVQLKKYENRQVELCRFNVIGAHDGKRDITGEMTKMKEFITIYLDEDELFLANVLPLNNTQSWGRLVINDYKRQISEGGFIKNLYHCQWYYQNSYDENYGKAALKIEQINNTKTVFITITTDDISLNYTTVITGDVSFLQECIQMPQNKSKPQSPNNISPRKKLQKDPNFKIQ